jgi:EAL domain-containing protein (putative c-di-GMP-specific phosphodiesterase class I)
VDRSFVANLETGTDRAKIAQSVATLAHSLGMKVTAEGVETERELAAVRELGFDYVQGHYFGRPVAGSDAMALLKKSRHREDVGGRVRLSP